MIRDIIIAAIIGLVLGFIATGVIYAATDPESGYLRPSYISRDANGNLISSFSPTHFSEDFTQNTSAPTPFTDSELWDVVVHSRDIETWHRLEEAEAHFGADCADPTETHPVTEYEDAIYVCDSEMMMALSASAYGVAYVTPAHLVDFTNQEATIRFDLSTARTTTRDWIDIWITPFGEQLIYPAEPLLPDLTGQPRRAIHIRIDANENSRWWAEIITDFEANRLPDGDNSWRGYENFLEPEFTRLDTFEIRISKDHIEFGMPEYGFNWVDANFTELDWSQGVVQLGMHSYNPELVCDFNETCQATIWHWDNIAVLPAVPFTLVHSDKRFVDATAPEAVEFNEPAPRNAFVQFAGIGENMEISFTDGVEWLPAELQNQTGEGDEKFHSYWMEIPEGTDRMLVRAKNWWGGPWHVRDFSIWSLEPRPSQVVSQ